MTAYFGRVSSHLSVDRHLSYVITIAVAADVGPGSQRGSTWMDVKAVVDLSILHASSVTLASNSFLNPFQTRVVLVRRDDPLPDCHRCVFANAPSTVVSASWSPSAVVETGTPLPESRVRQMYVLDHNAFRRYRIVAHLLTSSSSNAICGQRLQ